MNTKFENSIKIATEAKELRKQAQEILKQAQIVEKKAVESFRQERKELIDYDIYEEVYNKAKFQGRILNPDYDFTILEHH